MNRHALHIFLIVCILFILPLIYYGWGFPFTELLEPAEPGKLAERIYSQELLARGEMPLWNPYLYSGHPHMACLQPATFYPPNFLYMILSLQVASNLILLLHYSAAGIFTFFFCMTIGLSMEAALLSAISFMFCGYLTAHRPFPDIMNPSIWLPLMLLLAHKIVERPCFKYAFLASLVLCIQIFGGHTQPVLYTIFICLAYVSYLSFKRYSGRKRWMPPLVFAATIGLGVSLAAVQLLPLQEVSSLSIKRGVDYQEFIKYSFHPLLLPTLIYPFLFGADFPSLYEGWYQGPWNLVEMSGYTGILPLCFALCAVIILVRKEAQVRFWGIVAAIALFLVLGKHNPLYRITWYFPFYNIFRAPARNWYEFDFAIAILAGFGLRQVMKRERSQRRIVMLVAGMLLGIVVISICLLAYWERHGAALLDAISGQVPLNADKMLKIITMKSNAVFIPIILMLASLCVMLLIVFRVKRNVVFTALFAILFIDLLSCGSFYWRYGKSGSATFAESRKHFAPLLDYIRNRETDANGFRICSMMRSEDDMTDCYPVIDRFGPYRSINGYGMMLSRDYARLLRTDIVGTTPEALFFNNRILSMLGVKYIIARREEKKFLESIRAENGRGLYREVAPAGTIALFENASPFPRAWCVGRTRPVGNLDEAVRILWSPDVKIDLSREVLIEGAKPCDSTSEGEARVVSYEPQRIEIRCKSSGKCLLVLSERFFPGWQAYVDGSVVPIYRANAILRGVCVPPGEHTIKFIYKPRSFAVGAAISGGTLMGLLVAAVVLGLKRGNNSRIV